MLRASSEDSIRLGTKPAGAKGVAGESPRRPYAIPTRDPSSWQLTTGHCPAVPTRASQSDTCRQPDAGRQAPSNPTTMTTKQHNSQRTLDTCVHLRRSAPAGRAPASSSRPGRYTRSAGSGPPRRPGAVRRGRRVRRRWRQGGVNEDTAVYGAGRPSGGRAQRHGSGRPCPSDDNFPGNNHPTSAAKMCLKAISPTEGWPERTPGTAVMTVNVVLAASVSR